MGMYRCDKCGTIFDANEAKMIMESHGLDSQPYEELMACPSCSSLDNVWVEKCEICGEWEDRQYIHGGVCEDCMDSVKNDYRLIYDMCEYFNEKVEVDINPLLASMFTEEEINKILLDSLDKRAREDKLFNGEQLNCWGFIREDFDWFGASLEAYLIAKKGGEANEKK